jgi:hypothetical protein
MGRGTVALVWLVIALGIGAAYGMGVSDGRKRTEGVAAERERQYEYRLELVTKMLLQRAYEDDALGDPASDGLATHPADREPRAQAPGSSPPTMRTAPIESALVSQGS